MKFLKIKKLVKKYNAKCDDDIDIELVLKAFGGQVTGDNIDKVVDEFKRVKAIVPGIGCSKEDCSNDDSLDSFNP